MSAYKEKGVEEEAPIHRIRITLTSRNVKSLEKVKKSEYDYWISNTYYLKY